jgi:diguanylate cyclase (GGDEF)-like protein
VPKSSNLQLLLRTARPELSEWLELLRSEWQAQAAHLVIGENFTSTAKHSALAALPWGTLLGNAQADLLSQQQCLAVRLSPYGDFEPPPGSVLLVERPERSLWTLTQLMRLKRYAGYLERVLALGADLVHAREDRRRIGNCLRVKQTGTFWIKDAHVECDATVAGHFKIAPNAKLSLDDFLMRFAEPDRARFAQGIRDCRELNLVKQLELKNIDGHWMSCVLTNDTPEESSALVYGLMRNHDEQRSAALEVEHHQKQLENLVRQLRVANRTDPLTGLANRTALTEQLSVARQAALRADAEMALLVLDVDHFKSYNDTYGHAEGDLALKTVAQLIASHVAENELAARFGGEEFCVLALRDRSGALALGERIRASIAAHPWSKRAITISIGISVQSAGASSFDRLFKLADAALYQAKAAGRNAVQLGEDG